MSKPIAIRATHGDAPLQTATLVAILTTSDLMSDKGRAAALTVVQVRIEFEVVRVRGVEVGGDAMYESMHSYIG